MLVLKGVFVAGLGNPGPVEMKVYRPEGKEALNDVETTEEAPSRGDCPEVAIRRCDAQRRQESCSGVAGLGDQ